MLKLIGTFVLVAALAVVLALAGCASNSPQPGPSPSTSKASPASSPPLSELQALARAQKATKAWYTLVPLSKAFKIMQGGWGGSNVPPPTTPSWVVIMRGDFGRSGGERYTWAVSVLDPHGKNLLKTSTPIDTFGAKLTPLPL